MFLFFTSFAVMSQTILYDSVCTVLPCSGSLCTAITDVVLYPPPINQSKSLNLYVYIDVKRCFVLALEEVEQHYDYLLIFDHFILPPPAADYTYSYSVFLRYKNENPNHPGPCVCASNMIHKNGAHLEGCVIEMNIKRQSNPLPLKVCSIQRCTAQIPPMRQSDFKI